MSSENLRTVSEVADQLRLSDRAVYDLCRSGTLRHFRLGRGLGAIRVAQADIDAYKDGCATGGDKTSPFPGSISGYSSHGPASAVNGPTEKKVD